MAKGKPATTLGKFYGEVLRRAFSGRFWLAERITGGITILFGLVAFWMGRDDVMNWLPALVLIAVFLGTVVVGLVIAPWSIFNEKAETLKTVQELLDTSEASKKSKLALEFLDNDAEFVTLSPTRFYIANDTGQKVHRDGQSRWVRIRVTNTGIETAKACRPYLLSLSKQNADGTFEPTGFSEVLPLAWANKPTKDESFGRMDLVSEVPQFVDVAYADSKFNNLRYSGNARTPSFRGHI